MVPKFRAIKSPIQKFSLIKYFLTKNIPHCDTAQNHKWRLSQIKRISILTSIFSIPQQRKCKHWIVLKTCKASFWHLSLSLNFQEWLNTLLRSSAPRRTRSTAPSTSRSGPADMVTGAHGSTTSPPSVRPLSYRQATFLFILILFFLLDLIILLILELVLHRLKTIVFLLTSKI
jgi:hypothetical protein